MSTYISPEGNPEVWDTKRDGYHTPEEWLALHPAPPVPVAPLADIVARAFERIKVSRDKRLSQGGLIWQGYLVSIDKEATDRMTSTAMQFVVGTMSGVRWKMSDGEYVDLDQAAFMSMSTAVGAVVQACYAAEEAKRREVLALPDAAAVLAWLDDARNLYTGWPDDSGGEA